MSLPTPEDTWENVPLYHQGNKRKVKSEESSGKRLARQGSSKPTRLSFLSLWLMGSLSPLARQERWKKKNPAAAAAGWWVLSALSLPFPRKADAIGGGRQGLLLVHSWALSLPLSPRQSLPLHFQFCRCGFFLRFCLSFHMESKWGQGSPRAQVFLVTTWPTFSPHLAGQ